MNEDAKAYTQRIRGYLGDRDPLEVLSSTPEILGELIRNTSAPDLQKPFKAGRWSKAEILAHLAEGEMVVGYRARMIVSEPGTPILAFDQDKWMEKAGYLLKQPEQTLALFKNLRLTNLAFLKSLSEEAWNYYGIHSERGKETISDIVALVAGHDLNHLKQLKGE